MTIGTYNLHDQNKLRRTSVRTYALKTEGDEPEQRPATKYYSIFMQGNAYNRKTVQLSNSSNNRS